MSYADWFTEEYERIKSNYTADLTFKRQVLGYWVDYSPADELRDRLNDALQGKAPALPVNTRYWRDLR